MWTLRPLRPANADQHLPQFPLIHVVDPPACLSQIGQRIRFAGCLVYRRRPLRRRSLQDRRRVAPLFAQPDRYRARICGQNLPHYAPAMPTTRSAAHWGTSSPPPGQTSGPTLTVPPWVVATPHTPRRHQALIPYRRVTPCRLRKRDNQQQYEYNMPQTWCVFHRPPPARDESIHTPSRLFCKVQVVPDPTSCYT